MPNSYIRNKENPDILAISGMLKNVFSMPIKEFGCERCSLCTLNIMEEIKQWILRSPNRITTLHINTHLLINTPVALYESIKFCLSEYHKRKSNNDESAMVGSSTIYDMLLKTALNAFIDSNYLLFSRIVSVFIKLDKELKDTLPYEVYISLAQQIEKLKIQGEEKMNEEDAFLENSNKAPKGKREKRVCSGGVLEINDQNCSVIDFSKKHILVIDKKGEEITGNHYCKFLPCQKELPFNILVKPAKCHGDSEIHYVKSDWLKQQCGKYYKLFEIVEVLEYPFYYSAICLALTSKRKDMDFSEKQFTIAYDLADPPTWIKIKNIISEVY